VKAGERPFRPIDVRLPQADIDRQTSGNLPMPVLPLDKVQPRHTRIGVTDITSVARTFNPN
jgi:hypothetical protein